MSDLDNMLNVKIIEEKIKHIKYKKAEIGTVFVKNVSDLLEQYNLGLFHKEDEREWNNVFEFFEQSDILDNDDFKMVYKVVTDEDWNR